MPTREEKVAQIEAALRTRFFQYVPKVEKPERVSWTEQQHDNDRLSRALAAYALVGGSELDDVTASSAITDGSDDGGIDALYFDRGRNCLVIVQSKYKTTGTAPSQEETQKTISGVNALRNRRFNQFNQAIQNKLDDIEEALDTAGVKLEVLMAFLGDTLGQHAINDLNTFCDGINTYSQIISWHIKGLDSHYDYLISEQTPDQVDCEITLDNWAGIVAPRKAFYGQISAADLASLVSEKGKALFERNIRHYLGSIGVNTAIERTVRSRPADFFYLNNGITAVAESIIPALGTNQRCAFGLKKLSIVNGAQTAGAITNATIHGEISPDAKLLITLIEIGNEPDDFGIKITKARNHQNTVRGVDFAALDPNQERLRQELASVGITYHYRPSAEARTRRDDAFTLEEAALALACFGFKIRTEAELRAAEVRRLPKPLNAIDFVVAAKKEISRLWEQDGAIYGELFHQNLSSIKLCRIVRMHRFIDSILSATERSESTYSRRMFFRHGRYFIMAFVAHHSQDVIEKMNVNLDATDNNLLSQRVNELAEIIYASSDSLRAYKGYLAIFRNLSDVQPLAHVAMQKLAELQANRLAVQQLNVPNV